MGKLVPFFFVLILCFPMQGLAQSNFTSSELDTLVSNIALYPDPLLVHVLTASTFGEELPAANAWAQGHRNLSGETLASAMEQANLNFDPSVQALLPFPTVLEMMTKYKTWCDQLGDAVSSQKNEVMDAVQRMRQAAYSHGHLKSDEKVTVTETENNITINPVRTEYVYVPVYNPRVVYYSYAGGYTRITYGTGVWLGTWYGEWGWGTCWFDWGPRVIYVRNTRWYAHRPIPHHPRHYNPPPRRHESRPAPRHEPRPAPRREAPMHKVSTSSPRPVPNPSVGPARTVPQPATNRAIHPTSSRPMNANVPGRAIPVTSTPARSESPRVVPAPRYNESYRSNESRGNSGKAVGTHSSTPSRSSSTNSSYRDDRGNENSGSSGHGGGRSGGFGRAIQRR